ncbi:MAG: VWA domain-containing protein, partial [Clostridia bacterium]|nr:VWA domain-containing protein [Clostridia bacterium]
FTDAESGSFTVKSGKNSVMGAFTSENRNIETTLNGAEEKANVIKLMFVVDVTGSMGDEFDYLTNELADVIGRVAANDEQTKIDLAFLFYRDDEDQEKFSYVDFINVNDQTGLETQRQKLAKQRASGGGDYPEAVDEALELAVSRNWGEENATRLIFHILDAPPHEQAENKTRYEKAVKDAAAKGIRINPILCSGADTLCEYLVRQEAIFTAGTFIYVTDHSGIGNSPRDPDVPNAVVEKLNDMLVRLINGYHTGTFAEPEPWQGQGQTQPTPPVTTDETAKTDKTE